MDMLLLVLFAFCVIKFSRRTVYLPDGSKKSYIKKSAFPFILIAIFLILIIVQQGISLPSNGYLAYIKHNILLILNQVADSLMVVFIALAGVSIIVFKKRKSKAIIRWLAYTFLIYIFFVGMIAALR